VRKLLSRHGCKALLEPGRSLPARDDHGYRLHRFFAPSLDQSENMLATKNPKGKRFILRSIRRRSCNSVAQSRSLPYQLVGAEMPRNFVVEKLLDNIRLRVALYRVANEAPHL